MAPGLVMHFVLLHVHDSWYNFMTSWCLSPELSQFAYAEGLSDDKPKKTAARPPKAGNLTSSSQSVSTDSAVVSNI